MNDAKKKPTSRKNIPDEPPILIGSSLDFVLQQTVLTVDSSLDKTYPEILESMRNLDDTLKCVAELQKDLGFQRRRLSKQASLLRFPQQAKILPAEGTIKEGTNGKAYIFLGGAWGDYIKPDSKDE